MKTAKDVMNTKIITINKETNLKEIIDIMKDKGIGELPVVEDGNVLGVVTRDDLLTKQEEAPLPPVIAFWDVLITLPTSKAFVEKINKITGYRALEIMTKEFLAVSEDERMDRIVTEIVEKKFGYAIVKDNNGKLSGIITKTDLINNSF